MEGGGRGRKRGRMRTHRTATSTIKSVLLMRICRDGLDGKQYSSNKQIKGTNIEIQVPYSNRIRLFSTGMIEFNLWCELISFFNSWYPSSSSSSFFLLFLLFLLVLPPLFTLFHLPSFLPPPFLTRLPHSPSSLAAAPARSPVLLPFWSRRRVQSTHVGVGERPIKHRKILLQKLLNKKYKLNRLIGDVKRRNDETTKRRNDVSTIPIVLHPNPNVDDLFTRNNTPPLYL